MTITSKFAGRCQSCGQSFPAGTAVEWARGAGARHATTAECTIASAATVTAPQVVVTPALASIAAFLLAAKARGLKFPKVRFLAPGGGEFRLNVAGAQSKAPGSIQVLLDAVWIGRVTPTGDVHGALSARPDLIAALQVIASDPAAAAKAYGALMCRCSFCDLPLTDDGSVEVGYGPVCARRYGLPHVAKGARVLSATA